MEKVRRQIEPFLDFEGPNAATMVNNYDWTMSLSTIDFLRDIGKHFPVNRMLARDVVRSRLEAGISYTEFSYILLQSLDYLNLYRDHGVRLQFGGSDQWGNLTGGVELIRRSDGGRAHAFATPLVTKADGTKYGKTEGGALWLDPEMMSPYAFHQFWLNVEDGWSASCCASSRSSPTRRSRRSRRRRPRSPTCGPARRRSRTPSPRRCTAPRRPSTPSRLPRRCSVGVTCGRCAGRRWLPRCGRPVRRGPARARAWSTCSSRPGLVKSKGEARRTIAEGGAYLNNERITDAELVPDEGDLIDGSWLVLRRGKKNLAGVEMG